MPKEEFVAPLPYYAKNQQQRVVEVDTGTDQGDGVEFVAPATVDKDGRTIAGKVVAATHRASNDASDDEEQYVAPVAHFEEARRETTAHATAANSTYDDVEALSNEVLRLASEVERAPAGSVERGRAEGDLVHAKDELRTALRTAASELAAELTTAKASRVAEIVADLEAIRDTLDALEDDTLRPAKDLSQNSAKAKTVMVLQRAAVLAERQVA